MTKDELKQLKENKDIKFIYKIPCSFYDEGYEYIIIGSNPDVNEQNVRFFSLDGWFLLMKSGSILPYVCSILSKSGKIKEYINIYEKPDIIMLRKYIINRASYLESISKSLVNMDMEIIQECLWGIQVIKESRVNRVDVFKERINDPFNEFMIASEPIYKMSLTNV